MKAINLKIFEDKTIGNCSNNGISTRFNEVLVEHPGGFITVDENNLPDNFCKIVTRDIFGKEYKHIEPVKAIPKGSVGYMFGGTLCYSSDSRFHDYFDYPLCLHDRVETQEMYSRLCN